MATMGGRACKGHRGGDTPSSPSPYGDAAARQRAALPDRARAVLPGRPWLRRKSTTHKAHVAADLVVSNSRTVHATCTKVVRTVANTHTNTHTKLHHADLHATQHFHRNPSSPLGATGRRHRCPGEMTSRPVAPNIHAITHTKNLGCAGTHTRENRPPRNSVPKPYNPGV